MPFTKAIVIRESGDNSVGIQWKMMNQMFDMHAEGIYEHNQKLLSYFSLIY